MIVTEAREEEEQAVLFPDSVINSESDEQGEHTLQDAEDPWLNTQATLHMDLYWALFPCHIDNRP